jgi:hypothetical protein
MASIATGRENISRSLTIFQVQESIMRSATTTFFSPSCIAVTKY